MTQAQSESWFEHIERELDRMSATAWAQEMERDDDRDREIKPTLE